MKKNIKFFILVLSILFSAQLAVESKELAFESSMDTNSKQVIVAKQNAFILRLNLSEEQVELLNKIKAQEQKELMPIKAKILKQQAKMELLYDEERRIRESSIQQFESILSDSQLKELNHLKEETRVDMAKAKAEYDVKIRTNKKHEHAVCPPDCPCVCHHPEIAVEPPNCPCPCHKNKGKHN